jgi:four helix bundle protein
LEYWKACREVRLHIANIVKKYPRNERFSLVNNMLRAARSTTNNIAEGYGRFHYKENIQFCRVSRGSLYELRDRIICSFDEGFIENGEYRKSLELITKVTALLNGYINYLKSRLTNNK